jgi:hypothetical protein
VAAMIRHRELFGPSRNEPSSRPTWDRTVVALLLLTLTKLASQSNMRVENRAPAPGEYQ